MAKITVQQISRRAKKIRRKGEKWINAIKRASNELKKKQGTVGTTRKAARGSSGRKTVPSKKKSVTSYKPRKPKHQTGHSSKKMDERLHAKQPGKRIVKGSGGKKHAYYEYRKNRSDMPGKLTGVKQAVNNTAYLQMINLHMKDAINAIGAAERRLQYWQELKRKTHRSEKLQRKMIDNRISEEKKFIATQKKELTMLKTLIR